MITRRGALALLPSALAQPAHAAAGVWRDSAPTPVAFSVRDREGRMHDVASFAGRSTLAHFWATWCVGCREEFAALERLQSDLRGSGLRVAAISIDRLGWPVIDRTVADLDLKQVELYHDLNREAAQAMAIDRLPTTLVLDRSGRELARILGAIDWSAVDTRQRLAKLLAQA
jgi:thiol-disulfide isomerase/thioredoxin